MQERSKLYLFRRRTPPNPPLLRRKIGKGDEGIGNGDKAREEVDGRRKNGGSYGFEVGEVRRTNESEGGGSEEKKMVKEVGCVCVTAKHI